jgi:hypothetical protein
MEGLDHGYLHPLPVHTCPGRGGGGGSNPGLHAGSRALYQRHIATACAALFETCTYITDYAV